MSARGRGSICYGCVRKGSEWGTMVEAWPASASAREESAHFASLFLVTIACRFFAWATVWKSSTVYHDVLVSEHVPATKQPV